MRAFGIVALVLALAGPAIAQQAQQQGQQPNQQQGSPVGQDNQAGQDTRSTQSTAAERDGAELPATASPLPAFGLLGLASLVGATIVRRLRRRP